MLTINAIASAEHQAPSKCYDSQMDIENTRVRALKLLVDEAGSQKQLAIALDVTAGYIGQLLSGYRPITEKNAIKMEDKLGLSRKWMDIDHCGSSASVSLHLDPPVADVCVIKQYTDVSGSMGQGITLRDQPGQITEWMVTTEWINKNIPANSGNKNLRIITGFGDSMRGMFNSGDPLIVDIGVNAVEYDGVYFFRVKDEGFIKRLQRVPGRGLLAISENKAYESWVIADDMDFEVFGRVLKVWKSEEF